MQTKKSSKYLIVYKKSHMNKTAMLTIQGQGLSHRFGVFDWLLGILSVGWNICLQLGSEIEGCLLYVICSKIYSIFARIECLQWY